MTWSASSWTTWRRRNDLSPSRSPRRPRRRRRPAAAARAGAEKRRALPRRRGRAAARRRAVADVGAGRRLRGRRGRLPPGARARRRRWLAAPTSPRPRRADHAGRAPRPGRCRARRRTALAHLVGAGVALRGSAPARARPRRQRRRDRGSSVVQRRRDLALLLERELGQRLRLVGQAPGEQLVGDDAEPVEVGGRAGLLAGGLLGRQVGGGARAPSRPA